MNYKDTRIYLLFISVIFSLNLMGQKSEDSILRVLSATHADRQNMTYYIEYMRRLNPDDTIEGQLVFDWICKNASSDSLSDIRANAYLALGRLFTIATQYGEATKYLIKAEEISEKNNYPIILAQTLNVLGSIYESNDPSDKAVHYYKESIYISKKQNYLPGIIKATYNLGKMQFQRSFEDRTNPRVGLLLMRNAYDLALFAKDTQSMITQANGLAEVYSRLGQHDSAIQLINDAEILLKKFGRETNLLNYYVSLGNNYRAGKEYQKALKFLNSGLALAEKYDAPRWLCTYYYNLADTYEQMGDYKNANYFNQLNIKMHNSLVTKENFIAAADLQNKYERAKKDNAILKLQAVSKQRSTLNYILIGATIIAALIGFLIYINFRKTKQLSKQQQALQDQKIIQLEKDRQLIAIDAMLKGQEEERNRVAKELHDGLGGLLSGAKYSFINLKDELLLSAEKSIDFNRSLEILDTTIADLKKIAHNLMPETLVRFGLKEAVRDFCNVIEKSTGIRLFYQYLGNDFPQQKTAEIFTYRIIQELINNAVKYADADEIFVEILVNENIINITVEDDGKGFDKNALNLNRGLGMKNIQYRVDYFNGSFEIDTAIGTGTNVFIKLFT